MVGTFGTTISCPSFNWNEQLSGTSTVSLGPDDLPRVGSTQPVVGVLDLPAVGDLLAEHAVLVAQAVADRGDLQRRQRVDEAGGQPAQAAVAQAGVGLLFGQLVPVPVLAPRQVLADERLDLEVGDLLARVRPIRNSIDR